MSFFPLPRPFPNSIQIRTVLCFRYNYTELIKVKNSSHFRWFKPKPPRVSHSSREKENAPLSRVEFLTSQWNVSLKCKVSLRKIKDSFISYTVGSYWTETYSTITWGRILHFSASAWLLHLNFWLPAQELDPMSHGHHRENWRPRIQDSWPSLLTQSIFTFVGRSGVLPCSL